HKTAWQEACTLIIVLGMLLGGVIYFPIELIRSIRRRRDEPIGDEEQGAKPCLLQDIIVCGKHEPAENGNQPAGDCDQEAPMPRDHPS
ncbi:MAG: hypothetical protein COU10_00195, partial [Candidatus Harrisonbacteria bacterium CG10_big_fil_rev_8_21_14_0_10_45_28]